MRQGRDVEILDFVGGHALLNFIPGEEKPALELIGRHPLNFANQDLLDIGQGQQGFGAEDLLVGRNLSPAEKIEAPLFQNLLGDGLSPGLGILVLFRKVHDPDAEIGVAVEGLAPAFDNGTKELVGNLSGDTRTVTRPGIGIQGSPVHQVADGAKTYAQDLVGALAVDLSNHADAAGVFLKRRIIERGAALMVG